VSFRIVTAELGFRIDRISQLALIVGVRPIRPLTLRRGRWERRELGNRLKLGLWCLENLWRGSGRRWMLCSCRPVKCTLWNWGKWI